MLRIKCKFAGPDGTPLETFIKERILFGRNDLYDKDPQHIEARVERIADTMGKLIHYLMDKNIIEQKEAFEMIGVGSWEMEKEGLKVV